MKIDRRHFLGVAGTMAGGALGLRSKTIQAARKPKTPADPYGCLMDLTACVGCRKCEQACNQVHGLPAPQVSYDDPRVFERKRRPSTAAYTVVNRYYTGKLDERNLLIPTFVKVQCMHCQDPACVSACIVGALTQKDNGAGLLNQNHRLKKAQAARVPKPMAAYTNRMEVYLRGGILHQVSFH